MRRYLVKRLLLIIPTLLVLTFGVFSLIRLIPGDVATLMVGLGYADTIQALRHELGLDQPIHVQYFSWLGNLFQGDLGRSLWSDRSIAWELGRRIPVTLELASLSIAVAFLLSIPIGILAAIRQDTWADYLIRTFAILGLSIPHFWLAVMVVTLPAIWFRWAPPLTFTSFTEDPLKNLSQFLIPAFILGLHRMGVMMRMMRGMMLEVLRQDYVRTAWAKGLRERLVVQRHVLKNSLIPVVSAFNTQIPYFLGSTVIIEYIFGMPGIGGLMMMSIQERDYPLLQGVVLFFAGAVIFSNLAVDIFYTWLNPKIRYT